jgi:hypothetical protein
VKQAARRNMPGRPFRLPGHMMFRRPSTPGSVLYQPRLAARNARIAPAIDVAVQHSARSGAVLLKTSSLRTFSIQARDGEIGGITDVLFEDNTWKVRWRVVDTGSWLAGREVLLPTSHLGPLQPGASSVPVDLAKRQVEESPGGGIDLPVSRQMERSLYSYYGWAPYWPVGDGAAYVPPLALTAAPPAIPAAAGGTTMQNPSESGDPHLRSVDEVTGYYIHAHDGEVGHVEDFLLDGSAWAIRYIVVDTRNWWPGKKVLIAPDWIDGIDWAHRLVRVVRTRHQIRHAPEYDSHRSLEPADEARLQRYYGTTPHGTATLRDRG